MTDTKTVVIVGGVSLVGPPQRLACVDSASRWNHRVGAQRVRLLRQTAGCRTTCRQRSPIAEICYCNSRACGEVPPRRQGPERSDGNQSNEQTLRGAGSGHRHRLRTHYDAPSPFPGAAPIVPPIPGAERGLVLRDIEDLDRMVSEVRKRKVSWLLVGVHRP